ncbi:RNA polymerase sigma factor SigI [Peribacillus sp. SCS-37]|uniref:RNA polymerase sigma factor SigI n=1 Tax=Paraperibacillus esterisolvens TaxID=3115296 RepID=UPI003905BC6C
MRLMLSLLFTAFKRKQSLDETILNIQTGDDALRSELIESFKPFIAKTVSSVCKRYIHQSDDEFSIGLIAFNEAIDKYSPDKGRSLLSFAETLIKRRIIDYIRSQAKHRQFSADLAGRDDNLEKEQLYDAEKSLDEYNQHQEAERRREEIMRFQAQLAGYDVAFSDLAENGPKHADARKNAISIAMLIAEDEELGDLLAEKKRLPIKQLEKRVAVSRKTIERNRKYIIAIALILSGDYIFMKDYIKGVLEE